MFIILIHFNTRREALQYIFQNGIYTFPNNLRYCLLSRSFLLRMTDEKVNCAVAVINQVTGKAT